MYVIKVSQGKFLKLIVSKTLSTLILFTHPLKNSLLPLKP